MRGTVERWHGGYIRRDGAGRRVYYICRRMGGVRFEISTRCDREDAAEDHLKLFLKNPRAYVPAPELADGEQPLYLDEDLAKAFLHHSQQKNTDEWVAEQQRVLGWWGDQL